MKEGLTLLIDIVLVYAEGRGGLEDVITTATKGLIEKGHKVRVFQAYPPNKKEWEDTLEEIYYYGTKGSLDSENLQSLAHGYADKLRELGKPDIILATH